MARILAARAARSMRGGGGAREIAVYCFVGARGVVVVVDVVFVVVLSLLPGGESFGGVIARILAARAARSMRGGGGARESVVFCFVGARGVVIVVDVVFDVVVVLSLLHSGE